MPSLVRRTTSLTMRQRLPPEMVGSTTTRALAKIVLRPFAPMLHALPWGFFGGAWAGGLPAHPPASPGRCRAWRGWETRSARHLWPSSRGLCPPPLDSTRPPSSCFLDEAEVLVRVGLLLAAGGLLVCGVLLRALAATGAPVQRQGGTA